MHNDRRIGYCSEYGLPPISRPRVFTSFSEDDKGQVALLRNLKNAGFLNFVDYSIKKRYFANWEDSAFYRIRESDVVLVALNSSFIGDGMYTEIQMAKDLRKPIIVVKNSSDIPLPYVLRHSSAKVIPFNCKAIQREIDRYHRYNKQKYNW